MPNSLKGVKMPPTKARVEITVLIDPDLWNEMKGEGLSDDRIKKSIEQSITLKNIPFRSPVMDIDEIVFMDYC